MGNIIITRADEVLETIAENENVVAVLSIEHPGVKEGGKGWAPRLEEYEEFIGKKIAQDILCFYDTEDRDADWGPDAEQIEQGLIFALTHLHKGDVIIHCHAGKCRSTGLALGVMLAQNPEKYPKDLVEELLEIRPIAAPNILVVEHLDDILGRAGTLVEAVESHTLITERRERANEGKRLWGQRNPDHMKRMYPGRKLG